MIRCQRVAEPAGFDAEVRQRGLAWLAEHPMSTRPAKLWVAYLPHLADGFRHRCAYTAMHVEDGTVDHYLSCATHRHLAYEWSNYRFTSHRMNSVKGTIDDRVLDPFAIGDDWFIILLPSLQMVATERVPPEERERAAFTLKRLGLRDGEHVIRRRRAWYEGFLEGRQSLAGLGEHAPLIARAVEDRFAGVDPGALADDEGHYRRFLASELTLPGLRTVAPAVWQAVMARLAPTVAGG